MLLQSIFMLVLSYKQVVSYFNQSLVDYKNIPQNITQKTIQKLAPKKNPRYIRSSPDPDPPAVFENPNLIPKILRNQEQRQDFADLSPEAAPLSCVPTPVKVLFRSTPTSPYSSSTSQSTPSIPPFTAHTAKTTTAVPVTSVIPVVPVIPVIPLIPANMANRYAPLQFPANPGALPQEYQSKITYFDNTGPFTALQHTKKMQDYFENYEIDDDSVRMRIFVQSLIGDVRTWFISLAANSITTPDELYQSFTNIWEKKKNPLHILVEYDTIKRGPQETVLEYCARFNNV